MSVVPFRCHIFTPCLCLYFISFVSFILFYICLLLFLLFCYHWFVDHHPTKFYSSLLHYVPVILPLALPLAPPLTLLHYHLHHLSHYLLHYFATYYTTSHTTSHTTLPRCVLHATILNSRAEAYGDKLEGDVIAEMTMHNPQLVKVTDTPSFST